MIIKEITAEEYQGYLPDHYLIYMTSDFCELNKYKVNNVLYLLFYDTKPRFVLSAGVNDNQILCPYSAPFGMLVPLRENTSVKDFYEAVDVFDQYIIQNNYYYIRLILPPLFYDKSNISMLVNALEKSGYLIKHIDLNFELNLINIDPDNYISSLQHNARKNLNRSMQIGLRMIQCYSEAERQEAYDIIKKNRDSRGYPLRMTYHQVAETSNIIKNEFFIVKKNEQSIASAIVFFVNEKTVQVIYWGDVPGYSIDRPMNFLSYQLFVYYKNRGFHYLDIGPSTENGSPNYGLCDFKQSIGCDISNKFTFEKYYKDDNHNMN